MVETQEKTRQLHIAELKKLSYRFYQQLAEDGETLTYGFNNDSESGEVEAFAKIADNAVKVTVGFDTKGGLRFNKNMLAEAASFDVLRNAEDSSEHDLIEFQIQELKKLSYEFYCQLANAKEPLTYGFSDEKNVGQVEMHVEIDKHRLVNVSLSFDIVEAANKMKSHSIEHSFVVEQRHSVERI